MKLPFRFLALLVLALPLLIISLGCDQARQTLDGFGLVGQDGSDGPAGPTGLVGNTGAMGESGIILLSSTIDPIVCDQCVGNTSFADGAVGDTIQSQIQAGAVMAANFAPGAVGSDELVDGSVGRVHLKPGAVTGPKIGAGQITAAKISPDAVLPGNFGANAIEFGQIAAGAVDTEHFILGAVNRVWTVAGKADTAITPGEPWGKLEGMSMELDGGTGGPYLITFDASFYAYTPAGRTVPATPISVRLVLIYGLGNTVVLDSRALGFVATGSAAGVRYNDLGPISLHWAGPAPKASYPLPHTIQVQWRSNLAVGDPAQNIIIEQRMDEGTRDLTVIQFARATTVVTNVP